MKTKLILFSCLLFSGFTMAQDFTFQASVGPVKKTGFYDILLTSEVTTHLKDNFSDIRLYDSKGTELGYILQSEQANSTQEFKEYSIIENKTVKECCTHLVLHNQSGREINNIHLEIRNSDVNKKARLTGSDDGKNWYIIKDEYNLVSLYDPENVSKIIQLHFPLSNYSYYKLDIKDSTSAPLQILRAGYFDTHIEDAKYLELPDIAIEQKDSSDKMSYIKLSFETPQFIDKLTFECEGRLPFYRKASINEISGIGKNKSLIPLDYFTIKSGTQQTIYLPGILAKELYLIVENNDNQPLEVTKMQGFQLMKYLTANLKAEEKYLLKFGNKNLSAPLYDLEYFRDSLSQNKNIIIPASVTALSLPAEQNKTVLSSWWIWISIAAIGILLAFMSVKMVKEMKT